MKKKTVRSRGRKLFYDLVFVVIISQLSHHFLHQITITYLLKFSLLFISIWFSCRENTLYCDRFDTESPLLRFFYVLQMLFIIFIAARIDTAFTNRGSIFIWLYVSLHAIILLQYINVYIKIKLARNIVGRLIFFYIVIIALWLLSLLFTHQLHYSLWGFTILLEIITPISSKKILLKQEAQVSSIHLPERFGLFTLIVLGETIANLIRGITLNAFTLYSASVVVVGLLITFTI